MEHCIAIFYFFRHGEKTKREGITALGIEQAKASAKMCFGTGPIAGLFYSDRVRTRICANAAYEAISGHQDPTANVAPRPHPMLELQDIEIEDAYMDNLEALYAKIHDSYTGRDWRERWTGGPIVQQRLQKGMVAITRATIGSDDLSRHDGDPLVFGAFYHAPFAALAPDNVEDVGVLMYADVVRVEVIRRINGTVRFQGTHLKCPINR